MSVILALDPGETTGFAVLEYESPNNNHTAPVETGLLAKWRGIDSLVEKYDPIAIVIEQFMLYPGRARVFSFAPIVAAEVIGAAEYIADNYNVQICRQSASVGKSIRLNEELFRSLRTPHEKDAVKHGVAYLQSVRWENSV